jgi:hypothetical protein
VSEKDFPESLGIRVRVEFRGINCTTERQSLLFSRILRSFTLESLSFDSSTSGLPSKGYTTEKVGEKKGEEYSLLKKMQGKRAVGETNRTVLLSFTIKQLYK